LPDSDFPNRADAYYKLLRQRVGGHVKNLRVVSRNGHVVLQGIVVTHYLKQFAQHLALGVFEGFALLNEIEVRNAAVERDVGGGEEE
jgi:hypothetical protein